LSIRSWSRPRHCSDSQNGQPNMVARTAATRDVASSRSFGSALLAGARFAFGPFTLRLHPRPRRFSFYFADCIRQPARETDQLRCGQSSFARNLRSALYGPHKSADRQTSWTFLMPRQIRGARVPAARLARLD